MASKKQVGAGIIALIAAVAGGGFALSIDFSTTTTISDDDITIINEGDTDLCPILKTVCYEDLVPDQYKNVCPLIDSICG